MEAADDQTEENSYEPYLQGKRSGRIDEMIVFACI